MIENENSILENFNDTKTIDKSDITNNTNTQEFTDEEIEKAMEEWEQENKDTDMYMEIKTEAEFYNQTMIVSLAPWKLHLHRIAPNIS